MSSVVSDILSSLFRVVLACKTMKKRDAFGATDRWPDETRWKKK
jgi:hypothetical protein